METEPTVSFIKQEIYSHNKLMPAFNAAFRTLEKKWEMLQSDLEQQIFDIKQQNYGLIRSLISELMMLRYDSVIF